jgi:hypothetical protein
MRAGETKMAETDAISLLALDGQRGRKMKRLGAFLATMLMAGALLATPALARGWYGGHDGGYGVHGYGYGHGGGYWGDGDEWREHRPYQGYGSPDRGYGYGYPYAGYGRYPGQGWNPGWGWHRDNDEGWFHHGGWFRHDDDD